MATKLSVGDKAPDFVGMSSDGREICLSEFSGKPVWLIFYRYATCPLCNAHLFSIPLQYAAAELDGVEVLAVFESPAETFPKGMNYPTGPKLTLVSDAQKDLYRLYATEVKLTGVFHPRVGLGLLRAMGKGFRQGRVQGALGQLPAHFLISEKGVVEDVHYGRHIDDHLPWDRIDAFLEKRRNTRAA